MSYFVYILKTINSSYEKTYVGYTNNLQKRLNNHNKNKGAKSTKGYKWELVYKKKFINKSKAMSFEYKLKKDRLKRNILINAYNKKQN